MKAMFRTTALAALIAAAPSGGVLGESGRYPTPDAAIEAMVAALDARDKAALLTVLGPENEDIVTTGDADEDRAIWGSFLADYKRLHRVEVRDGERATLFTGRDFAPFPIEIALEGGSWSFDGEGAREEIRMRRIGANELAVIAILDRAREVQEAYRRVDHDGDGVMEFAADVLSSPGNRDGLYWPDEDGGDPSPFDSSIARADLTGYRMGDEDFAPDPYEGYYFRILKTQGEAAPGGAYSYLVNGHMVAGYALVAFPAAYGETGIMSFMVGEDGIVYEADLGEDTLDIAAAMESYDPDETWLPVDVDHWFGPAK